LFWRRGRQNDFKPAALLGPFNPKTGIGRAAACARERSKRLKLLCAFGVFREGVENRTRGACAPHPQSKPSSFSVGHSVGQFVLAVALVSLFALGQ
jgi:hypothetical protein